MRPLLILCLAGWSFGCASAQAPKSNAPTSDVSLTNASLEGNGGAKSARSESDRALFGARVSAKTDEPDPTANPWDRCPFPQEADKKSLDSAVVVARVVVRPDGSAEDVEILRDPGHGFGDAARSCALKQLYVPARDAEGNVVAGKTRPFLIRYMR